MNIGFIGMGNMGQMLITALARSGVLQPGQMFISTRTPEKLLQVTRSVPGVHPMYHNSQLPERCSVLFLCVKPADIKPVLEEIGPYITSNHLLVSITNTLDNAKLERSVEARVAKVIPSVVQAAHAGVSLLIFGERCTSEDKRLLHHLFSAISHPYVILESQARVASNLTSCGPAFYSYIFRSLAQAVRTYQPDLSEEVVNNMIRYTAQATLKLMEQMGFTFDDIINKVSTPGGVTADGIKVLDEQMAGVWEQVCKTTIIQEEAKKARVEL